MVNKVNSPLLEMTDRDAEFRSFIEDEGDTRGQKAYRSYSSSSPQHKEGLDT